MNDSQTLIHSDEFKEMFRKNIKFFQRERKLSFQSVILGIINAVSKSLSVELYKLWGVLGLSGSVSKQAFSNARYKIRHEAFKALNNKFVELYYADGDHKKYKGKYLIFSTDASYYQLPYTKDLIDRFGVADNGQGQQPICLATGVKIWDCLNQVTISSRLDRYNTPENRVFKHVWKDAMNLFPKRKANEIILLGDRHYPAFWLINELNEDSTHFVFRCSKGFCREVTRFQKGPSQDETLVIPIGPDKDRRSAFKRATGRSEAPSSISVRAVSFILADGETACLLTSFTKEEMTYEEVCEVFRFRWDEETSFGFDKNRSEIENFSAKKAEGILQDWHANTLATNYLQLFIEDAQEILDAEQKQKRNKHKYKINKSVALGILKDELPKMLFGNEKAEKFYSRILKEIVRHRQPVRPNRTYPRRKKHKLKYPMNLRRVT